MIRAVILDYDGTLITFDRTAAFAAALEAVDRQDAALARDLAAADRAHAVGGRHTRAELFATHLAGADPEAAECGFWKGIITTTRPMAGAEALIGHCHSGGLRLGLLTDWDGTPGRKSGRLAACKLTRAFDAVVIAGETVPETKPHPASFEAICTRLGVTPAEAVMIGDKVDADLMPAHALGMRTVWIRGEYPGAWSPAVDDLAAVIPLL